VNTSPTSGSPPEDGELPLQLGRTPAVVGIEKGHELPGRHLQRGVARDRLAAVGDPADDQPRVLDGREHLGRVVGGAVVDHDDLDVVHGLVPDALDRLGDEVTVVVRGDDDAGLHAIRFCSQHVRVDVSV
jgi:hypothetical protein